MTAHSLWIYVHILLLVYWLGADLGVLLLALAAKRSTLSFAERAFALRMATIIDFLPRICFTLMFPVGLQLTQGAWAQIPSWVLALAWAIALGWIALIFAVARSEGSPRAKALNHAQLLLQTVLLLVIGTIGVRSWLGLGPFRAAGWPQKSRSLRSSSPRQSASSSRSVRSCLHSCVSLTKAASPTSRPPFQRRSTAPCVTCLRSMPCCW